MMKYLNIFLCVSLFSYLVYAEDSGSEYMQISKLEQAYRDRPTKESREQWRQYSREAYIKNPMDIKVASQYAYIHYLTTDNPADGIKILLPFMNKLNSNSEIALALWRIFDNGIINAKANRNSTLESGTPWGLLLKGYDKPLTELEMMRSYWAKYIPEEQITPKWLISNVKSTLNDVDETQCLQIWKNILTNINEYNLKQERTKFYLSQGIQSSNVRAIRTQSQDNSVQSLETVINELATFSELPNTLEKIELTLNKITRFRKDLRPYPDIPNFKELEQSIGEYEAQIVNIAYQAYILRDFTRCLKNIQTFREKHKKNDARVLAAEIYCMQKSNSPTALVVEKIDQLLKLEPHNHRAFMMKRMLEAQEELKQISNKESN